MMSQFNLNAPLSAPIVLVISLIAAGFAVVNQSEPPIPLEVRMFDAAPGKARYAARAPAGSLIEVTVAAEPYHESLHGPISMDGETPSSVLSRFQVSIDGSEVIVPAREYVGLGDPHIGTESNPIKIEHIVPDEYYVYISGGDGAGAHTQRLVFSGSSWLRTEFRDSETWEYFTGQAAP